MTTPHPVRLSSLTLTTTQRCNLRCTYCTVPLGHERSMPDAVVDAAARLLARHAAGREVTLSFYGGEPMLALDRCQRAVDATRSALDGKRRLRLLTPTNALAIGQKALAWCRAEDVELALSIDGNADETERRFAGGRLAGEELLEKASDLLEVLPPGRLLARMTVTPANVDRLAANVQTLARLGFARIVYLPAFEEDWDDQAVAAFGREHRRLGTWQRGAQSAGRRVPDLPAWRAIEQRLVSGRRRGACGAGNRIAAVAIDGGLYPCYRLVFRGDDDTCRLGDVHTGFDNAAALARFARFDPDDVVPEIGECATCPAEDGCTHACPALGLQMLGDVRRVPAIACRLMREQVAAIRTTLQQRAPRRRLAAALVATAMTLASAAAASCGGSVEGTNVQPATGGAGGMGGAGGVGGVGGALSDAGGGLCPVQIDAGPGICTGGSGGAIFDAGGGGDAATIDVIGPGLCAQTDAGGGLCPVQIDAASGGSAGAGGDAAAYDGSGGGLCAYMPPDSGTGGWGAGLC